MKTSLTLIGYKEIQGLTDLLSDVGEYFDEVVVVSTAHNKKFMKAARKLGCKVFDEYFGESGVDFDSSAARNSAFKHATGDILATFDLDDRVPNADVIPEIYKAMETVDWVYCTYNYAFNGDNEVIIKHLKPRFIKKDTGIWQTSPHDDLVPSKSVKSSEDKDFLVVPLQVNHQNFYSTPEDMEKIKIKAQRNLGIMLNELKRDGDKTDLRTIQQIGNTLMALEDYETAIKFLMKHYNGTGAKENRFWSLKSAAFCYRQMGDYDNAINLLLEGLKLYPQWQTMYFALADIYSQLGKNKEVIEWTITGMSKSLPETTQNIEPLEYDLLPMGRLADAYLMTGQFEKAERVTNVLNSKYPTNKSVKELTDTVKKTNETETFVKSFIRTADMIRRNDRLKAIKLFDCLPNSLDEDIRIQEQRSIIVPPKNWSDKSIVIYCGKGLEDWAYPSIFSGIGGSEGMVIRLSRELTKLGYEVTVYNQCGDFRGNYDGVEYLPFYHFNTRDNFNTLIAWRNPRLFETDMRAKKKIVWLHDIAAPWQFSDKGTENTDKFIFLSKWHRNNVKDLIPDSKVFISNNGIEPEDYQGKLEKKEEFVLTCSYDRGVLTLIRDIMPLVHKKLGRKIKTHICYGWNNIDKEIENLPELKKLRDELTPLLGQDWVEHHGRISHKEVAELLRTSIIYPYSTEFGETNCMSSQAAQANGCYVLTTTNSGGVPEYLKFGEAMPFNNIYTDKKQQQKYANRLVELIKNPPKITEAKRQDIIKGFSLEETAKSWKEIL